MERPESLFPGIASDNCCIFRLPVKVKQNFGASLCLMSAQIRPCLCGMSCLLKNAKISVRKTVNNHVFASFRHTRVYMFPSLFNAALSRS